jgi:hypothetical protein
LKIKPETGRPLSTLIALCAANDPFAVGEGARRGHAEWFAELWHRIGFAASVHNRRIHYALLSQSPPIFLRDGKAFENTDLCWHTLCNSARDARYLNLVPAKSFIDRRTQDASIHLDEAIWQAITDRLVDVPTDYEWPEPDDGDEDEDPLFDSRRSYMEQIDRYKAYQDKPTDRRPRRKAA